MSHLCPLNAFGERPIPRKRHRSEADKRTDTERVRQKQHKGDKEEEEEEEKEEREEENEEEGGMSHFAAAAYDRPADAVRPRRRIRPSAYFSDEEEEEEEEDDEKGKGPRAST